MDEIIIEEENSTLYSGVEIDEPDYSDTDTDTDTVCRLGETQRIK